MMPTFAQLRVPDQQLRALNDFHSHLRLNVKPALAFGLPIFVLFAMMAVFLEMYVVGGSTANLAVFVVGSYIVFSSYFVANHYMIRASSSYQNIPDDKKFYVLSNLIKSAVLLAYCPSAAYTLYRAMGHDEWSTPRIRNMGVLYSIPDAVSLILVTRMAMSTKVHHICVILFMVVNLFVTYENETVGRALVVYAVSTAQLRATRRVPGIDVTRPANGAPPARRASPSAPRHVACPGLDRLPS
jgi:hypothetical protein